MKSMKKNLVFWTIIYEKLAMAMFLGVAVYLVMMSSMAVFPMEELGDLWGFMVLFFSIMILTNGYSGMLSYFPLSISMGTTRKGSFVAMQIVQHVIVIQFLVLAGIAYCVVEKAQFGSMMKEGISILGGGILLFALSNLVCGIAGKVSRSVGTAFYVITLLVGIGVSVLFVVLALSDGGSSLNRYKEFLASPYFFLGGLLADSIAIGIYYQIIKKQDLLF